MELLNYLHINEQVMDLEKSKQILFRLIYILGLIELETLKTYIKINLANEFF